MHFLDRKAISAPDCLAAYDHRTQTWDDVGPCKPAIRAQLATMQIERCAYCEAPLFDGGHIEHFRRKNDAHFPELTFDWTNLFLSCDSPSNCGHFKDRRNAPTYNPKQLLKPDEDDPEVFLYFHSNGEVRPRSNADAVGQARANETIRAFGLNDPALKDSRRRALNRYLRDAPFETLLSSLAGGEKRAYVQIELLRTEAIAFRTTIHHFLKTYL